jgi:hypothetical protein
VPHGFFHHGKAVEKILLVTEEAPRHHCFLGFRSRSRQRGLGTTSILPTPARRLSQSTLKQSQKLDYLGNLLTKQSP